MTTTALQTDRFEVGQIVCSSYGYDMTLVEYYVVDRMTKSSVWLRPIETKVFGDDGRGEGKALPNTGMAGTRQLCLPQKDSGFRGQAIRVRQHQVFPHLGRQAPVLQQLGLISANGLPSIRWHAII